MGKHHVFGAKAVGKGGRREILLDAGKEFAQAGDFGVPVRFR